MNKYLIITILLSACISKQEVKPIYDEASLKTFVLSIHTINEQQATKQLDSILNNASNDSLVFRKTISFLETPFSNPNSSYRSQSLYSKLLDAEIKSRWYNGYEKQVAAGKLKLLQQNNDGNLANDFTYITPTGDKKRMYAINAKFLLLYFNNPECNACKEMRQALAASSIISQKIKTGELRVLSVYTDPDEKLWLHHLNEYPPQWIQGRDDSEYLYKNKIYDLRAIPTIYLLDKDKKVLLKDCVSVGEIERVIE